MGNKKTNRKKRRKIKRITRDNKDLIELRKKAIPSCGEKEIMDILEENGINYIRELYVEGLYNPNTQKPLFFDFYLPDYRVVIEFDGPHHFKPVYGENKLWQQCTKDRIKNEFCQRQKVKMLRIPYYTKSIEMAIYKFFDKHFPV